MYGDKPWLLKSKTIGCRWVYAIKVGSTSEVDNLEGKGYTQIYHTWF